MTGEKGRDGGAGVNGHASTDRQNGHAPDSRANGHTTENRQDAHATESRQNGHTNANRQSGRADGESESPPGDGIGETDILPGSRGADRQPATDRGGIDVELQENVFALVGAVGGAGTTRLSLEFAATLARAGLDVVVLDAAFATQGLAVAVPGSIEVDVTEVVTTDRPLADATTTLDLPLPGRVTVAPARAPFERLARAGTAGAAQRLADRISTAADEYDVVLVDVPPVATNQALATVTAADRVAVVLPDSQRGADALARTRDRLFDVDAGADAVVANFADPDGEGAVPSADARVPECETTALAAAPTAVEADEFSAAVAEAVETVVGVDLGLPEPESASLADYLPR